MAYMSDLMGRPVAGLDGERLVIGRLIASIRGQMRHP